MESSFQPEKPYESARRSTGRSSYVVLAVVSALLVMMLVALGLPQLTGESGTNWLLTIVAGVAVFLGILAYGAMKQRGNQERAER